MHIESLVPQGRARCLDVGSGDPSLADAVHECVTRTDWLSVDARTIPHGNGEFDVAVLCDVLRREPGHAARLLAEAGRVAQHVLVKDRFDDGPNARPTLRIMDFVGGWGGRVSLPKRSFTREAFVRLAAEQRLLITALDCELSLEDTPDGQFIAVLTRALTGSGMSRDRLPA